MTLVGWMDVFEGCLDGWDLDDGARRRVPSTTAR